MTLTPTQQQLFNWVRGVWRPETKLFLWQGDVRSGKTWGASYGLVTHSLNYVDKDFIVAGRSASSVERNVVGKLLEAADAFGLEAKRVRSRSQIQIGSNRFHIFGAPNVAAQDTVQGMDAAGAVIDEAALIDRGFIDQVIARCSEAGSRVILTFNPLWPAHWLFREWIMGDVDAIYLKARLDDAVAAGIIPQETFDFYLRTLTGHRRKRWLEGEWAAASGLCLPSVQDCERLFGKGDCIRVEAGVDFGISDPTAAVFFGEYEPGHWVTLGEYYHGDGERTAAEHAAQIKALGEMYGCSRYWLDPSAAALRAEFSRASMLTISGDNAVLHGIDTLESACAEGRLLVNATAPNLLSEAALYSWREYDGPEMPDPRNLDHACDAARYFAMGRLRRVDLRPVAKLGAF